ncbi:hypothetical protein ACP70R_003033 [Stipagrostis hirtigluma subsp. patula]
MSAAPLLMAAGVGRALSRSAEAVVAKAAVGFHLLRIDGYSWTKTIPSGDYISSEFELGGRSWKLNYYPNGTDMSKDYGSIAVFLELQSCYERQRVRAQYKFSLLDHAGIAAYELPAETRIFTSAGDDSDEEDEDDEEDPDPEEAQHGYAEFISMEELERRRESLLSDDCLAIRCDVGVAELESRSLGQKYRHTADDGSDYSDESDDDEAPRRNRRRTRRPLDDMEYIRRCIAERRRRRA